MESAVGCVLWSRLVILTATLGALALSASSPPIQILGAGCGGLVAIVAYEQLVVRRRLERIS